MFDWLSDIWTAIKDLPFLIADLLVGILNAFVVAIAALATLLLSLLPGFPDAPSAPGGVLGFLWWVVPVEALLAFFMLMVACWVSFLAIKVGLRWVKAL
jgi:hypothetical protein